MAFKNIKSKSASMGKKSMSALLKVNKYENPQAVLDLIAHICTNGVNLSVTDCFGSYRDKCNELSRGFLEKLDCEHEFIEASLSDLTENCCNPYAMLPVYIEQPFTANAVNVAVGGGYSSGKSSFLNSITGLKDVLPTGIEPVSMVNTYISFSAKSKKLEVLGRNLKREIVKLNRQVLDCIQHSSKSKVYVSSVLEELYVNIPLPEDRKYLESLVFVDTPGYNNSDNANAENGKKDCDTSKDALQMADCIFWCIDVEAGTISQKDIDLLNEVLEFNKDEAFPFVIVFNKMDKKPESEVIKILKDAWKICQTKLKKLPWDIIAYSALPNHESIFSLLMKKKAFESKGVSKILSSLFSQMREQVKFVPPVVYWNNELASYFDEEILTCDTTIKELEKERKELAKQKDEQFRSGYSENDSDQYNHWLPNIKDVLLDSYDELADGIDTFSSLVSQIGQEWKKSLDRELVLHHKVGWFEDASRQVNQYNSAIDRYNSIVDKVNKVSIIHCYDRKERKSYFQTIANAFNDADFSGIAENDDLEDKYKNVVESKQILKDYKAYLQKKKEEVGDVLAACCTKGESLTAKRLRALQVIKTEEESDIFSAIANDNMPRFLDCFSEGVDLTKCNNQGFSPLTYASKNSNNAMMKFLVQHQANLSLKDENGYNALETAAIYHCQDICELLLKAEPNLKYESQSLVDLANNDKFEKWLTNM